MAAQAASSSRAGPPTAGPTTLSTTTDGVSHPPVSRGGSATSANSGGGTPQIRHTKGIVSDDLSSELWAMCPAPNSYLLQVIRSKGINVAHIHVNDITKHDSYHRWLNNIGKHHLNLITELPPYDTKEPSARMKKTFSRWMAYAAAAKEGFIIAPRRNHYWPQWESWLVQQNFKTSYHTWCGLGIRDYDSGKLWVITPE